MKHLRLDVYCSIWNFTLQTPQSNCSSVCGGVYHVSLSYPSSHFPRKTSQRQSPLGSQIHGLVHCQEFFKVYQHPHDFPGVCVNNTSAVQFMPLSKTS